MIETDLLSKMKHDHIIEIFDVWQNEDRCVRLRVFCFCSCATLRECVRSSSGVANVI